jgi:hypothetical protein
MYVGVEWINLAQDREKCWVFVNTNSFSIGPMKMSESQIDYERIRISFSCSGGNRLQWLPLLRHLVVRFLPS